MNVSESAISITFVDGWPPPSAPEGLLKASIDRSILFVTVWLCSAIIYFRWTRRSAREAVMSRLGCKPGLTYPHREPILGLDVLWMCAKALNSSSYLATTQRLIQDFGNTVQYLFFGRNAIVTTEPENIKAILSSKFQDFSLGPTRKHALKPLFGDGIFNVDGAAWKHSRVRLRPHVSRKRESDLDIFEFHIQHLIAHIPEDGSAVDLQPLFSYLALDMATEVFLGKSTGILASGSKGSEGGRKFAEAVDYSQQGVCELRSTNIFEIVRNFFGTGKLRESLRIMNDGFEHIVAEALANEPQVPEGAESNLLQELIRETQDIQQIKADVLNIVLAGKDTTMALLSNIWFVLARRPEIFDKLCAELSILDNRRPTLAQLNGLKYLRYVVNESLRLYPPAPINQRTAEVDTCLPRGGGPDGKSPLFVAKGASVGYSLYALHRRPDLWGPDAEEFRPERWEGLRPGWSFLPFNGGPRICLGQQYALTKVMYITARMVQHFSRVETRDPRPWEENLGLSCYSKHGVQVALIRNEPTSH